MEQLLRDCVRSIVKEVRLFKYFNGIYILAFCVRAEDIRKQKELETWLHFTRLARLIYPSFPEQVVENKIAPLCIYDEAGEPLATAFDKPDINIPEKNKQNISGVVRYLLEQFSPDSADALNSALDRYKYLYDDRMFVSVAYGLQLDSYENSEEQRQMLQKIVYLATWVDRTEDVIGNAATTVYAEDSLEALMQDKVFDFWKEKGGVFSFTDYSNVYVYNGWFFNNIIAPNHIPYIYDRMLVQALFYQASLRLYDDKISQETHELLEHQKVADIRKQRGNFIRFTNQYWFHSLTNQMQGKRIFDLQVQGLELQKHYDIIKDELERTDEYLQVESNDKLNKSMTRLTVGGLTAAVLAIVYAVIPLLDDHSLADLLGIPAGILLFISFLYYCFRKPS